MKRRLRRERGGLTLLEVLIAMLILLIGVTSIMGLFPLGAKDVQQAVHDTRSTILAGSAWSVVELKGLLDDPLHRDPRPGQDISGNPTGDNFLQAGLYDASPNPDVDFRINAGTPVGECYHLVPVGAASIPIDEQTNVDTVPILIDPLLVHVNNAAGSLANDGSNAARALAIPYNAFASLGYTPLGLRVVTTAEVATIVDTNLREAHIRRWFTSPGDLEYDEENRGRVLGAPGATEINNPDFLTNYPLSTNGAVAQRPSGYRQPDYSWAVMWQGRVTDTAISNPDNVVPSLDLTDESRARLMVFFRRNLFAPVTPAVAAFVDDDTRVTVRYASGARPEIRKRSWLVEMTISNAGLVQRTFAFHRVATVDETSADRTDNRLQVTLERAPSGYQTLPGARNYPDAQPDGNVDPSDGIPTYFPVLIFDGLQEVYDQNGALLP